MPDELGFDFRLLFLVEPLSMRIAALCLGLLIVLPAHANSAKNERNLSGVWLDCGGQE